MLNSITMVGRLTRDPELRSTASGMSVASFTIACDDSRKGPNGERQTVFMNCSLFGKGADSFVKFTRKGHLVGVTGRLTKRKYLNRQNVEVTTTEIACDRAEFMEPKAGNTAADAGYVSDAPAPSAPYSQVAPSQQGSNLDSISVIEDDLPF